MICLVWQFWGVFVTVVNCQSHDVWFSTHGQERALFNNSYIYYDNIGDRFTGLKCKTQQSKLLY